MQEARDVAKIYVGEDLESRVLMLSSKGQLTVADADLGIQSTRDPVDDEALLVDSFIFPRRSCSFLPTRTAPPRGVVAVLFLQIENATRLQILAICDDEVVELGNRDLKVQPDVSNIPRINPQFY